MATRSVKDVGAWDTEKVKKKKKRLDLWAEETIQFSIDNAKYN